MPLLLSVLLGTMVMQAVTPAPQRFTSGSELVVLHVTVVDRDSGYVSGLPREAFTIYENGTPQPVSIFETADIPVTAGLVIDSSISMHRRREAIVAAGAAFVDSSHADDELFTVFFNERVWPGLPPGQTFTNDREVLRQSLSAMRTRGQTALFDGLQDALGRLERGGCQKKVLVVVSDGGDNASRARFDEVLQHALRMDAVIYTVSIHDEYERESRPDVLKKLAAVTGGEAYFVRNAMQVKTTFERIARDIRSGYVLGYTPPAGDGYRAVRVVVQPPDRRRVAVRARSGYQK